ncbi:hypothetical protein IFM89_024338 [Coptis chinensis]|uniref:BAH domain-containing protein n=1 Tax=Coptis chinensis TaxID=261450 RepID=A0A835IUW1_9MAGN|nr:hypothetical protein IFM89_024338 [Coptis chinensis]
MFYHFAHSEDDEDVNTTDPSSNPVVSSFVAPQNVKLKSRREVLDWLSSVVSDSSPRGSFQHVGRFFDNEGFNATLKDSRIRNLGVQSKAFLWLGSSWTCRKRRKHYRSFCRNGITISVHDFVYVLAEENKRLVAYLEDLYEDSRSNKMVVVRWFHKIDEVGIILPPDYNDREIFFSLCLQDLSVECIDGLATVLSPQHFEKYLNVAKCSLWEPFLCHRQFDNDEIKDFDITQVQGYWKQEILRCMYTTTASTPLDYKPFDDNMELHDCDDNDEDASKSRTKKKHRRSNSKDIDQHLNDKNDAMVAAHLGVQKFCNGLVNCARVEMRGLLEPNYTCWVEKRVETKAVVIKRSKEKVKVRYQDIKDAEDDSKNVEEWVLASRIAVPDELGIHLTGRTTVRPFPLPNKDGGSLGFVDVGSPVDACWHDGWWEGIVVRKEADGKMLVYFPGEKKLSIFCCNDLRRSQDWLCEKWNFIEGRMDLVSSILANIEAVQGGGKSCVEIGHSIQLELSNNRQIGSSFADFVSSKKEEIVVKHTAPNLETVNDFGKGIAAVPNIAKDTYLAQLRWKTSRKRGRNGERLHRRGSSGLKQHSDGSSSSSREDMEPSPDHQRFLAPNSRKFDHESCKYQRRFSSWCVYTPSYRFGPVQIVPFRFDSLSSIF